MTKSNTYWTRLPLAASAKCTRCGRQKSKKLNVFYDLWEKINWFRGDDILLQTCCNDCYKEVKNAERKTK